MTRPPSINSEHRSLLWKQIYPVLLQHAIQDSRFHYDFLSFTPDFQGSESATERVVGLPCYKSATTLLVTPDNSLQQLRHRALKDGKKVLVATYRLRRGFVLLNPQSLSDAEQETASWLDGMERPGVGRYVTLAQLQEEAITVDLCATGGLAFNTQGVVIWEGSGLLEVQWAMLQDIKVLGAETPVVAVAHSCQVIDEMQQGLERIKPEKVGEVQCDFVVTPEKVIEVEKATKPTTGVQFELVDPEAMTNIPPLQELKGIRMMEKIMKDTGFEQENGNDKTKEPNAEEQLGINMVEKIMKGFKA